ncbi:MAG: helix-turn-helix domain-containing protein [Anaerolineaceae bacterium]|nr:helix-turn-helix domain-containing protein [Anaerolineaceae bacterium]
MAENQLAVDRRHELAEFLRSRRARLQPEHVGLPNGTRRRTPGLRREEVAMLAGVSPEWYTWLEQGRDINVSTQVLESLAHALRLDANEREHLFLLASGQPPPIETYQSPTVSHVIKSFLDQQGTAPACALDVRSNVLAWNAAYGAVFGDYSKLPARERNLFWRIFTNPHSRVANEHWDELAMGFLAQFRARYGRYINDPWWAQQVADLSAASPEFRELWERHDVGNLSEGQKKIRHQIAGDLCFDTLWLQTIETDALQLLIHVPHDQETAHKIERLLSAG